MSIEQVDINQKEDVEILFPPDASYVYKIVDGMELKLYVFNPDNHNPDAKVPGAIFFFGGGWVGGSPKQFYPFSKELAKRGMIAICAEYRTKQNGDVDPFECLKDAKSAVRWCRINAAKLGLDPNKFAAGGGSAGGHLAAACAFCSSYNHDDDDVTVSCLPDALLLFNPVIDNGPGGYGHDRVGDQYTAFSPLHNIGDNPPPVLFQVGDQDPLLPADVLDKFKKLIEDKGGECEMRIYQDAAHGFFNYGRADGFYEPCLKALIEFVRKHHFIK